MVTVAKMDGKIVEIVRVAHKVGFSDKTGWIMICSEIAKKSSIGVKWIPADTRFEWVREFNFG
jgi:hypothetical protein